MSLENPPFRPGAGRVPSILAGRERVVGRFTAAVHDVESSGEGPRPWVIFGLRGVGKTALLNHFSGVVRDRGWITVRVEASRDRSLAQSLVTSLYRPLRDARPKGRKAQELVQRALRVFASFQLRFDTAGGATFGFGLEPEKGIADSGVLSHDLVDLLESLGQAAREEGSGVLLTIDELQDASIEDLQALNVALHTLGQDSTPVPVFFIGAGLPALRAVLAEATSYAERLYEFRPVDLLDHEATIEAFTVPTTKTGVSWDTEALDVVVTRSGGYPFFVQVYGQHVWEERTGDRITLDAANEGLITGLQEIDDGLYRSRWERSTATQRAFMAAMAHDHGEPSRINDLVERLGKSNVRSVSPTRAELMSAGLIYAPERGLVSFTVPGMADFIARQPAEA